MKIRGPGSPHGERRRTGFTMVELMFAIGVFMVAIFAALSTQITSLNLLRVDRETRLAVTELQSCMEEVLLEELKDVPVTFPNGQTVATFSDRVLDAERIVVSYPNLGAGGGAVPDPLEIVAVITWNDYRGRQRTMRLASLKTR